MRVDKFDKVDLFLCCAAADFMPARAFASELQARGIVCGLASPEVLVDERPAESSLAAIVRAKAVVLIYSAEAKKSRRLIYELRQAIDQRLPILAINLEGLDPSGPFEPYLGGAEWLDHGRDGDAEPDAKRVADWAHVADQVRKRLASPAAAKRASEGALSNATAKPAQGTDTPAAIVADTREADAGEAPAGVEAPGGKAAQKRPRPKVLAESSAAGAKPAKKRVSVKSIIVVGAFIVGLLGFMYSCTSSFLHEMGPAEEMETHSALVDKLVAGSSKLEPRAGAKAGTEEKPADAEAGGVLEPAGRHDATGASQAEAPRAKPTSDVMRARALINSAESGKTATPPGAGAEAGPARTAAGTSSASSTPPRGESSPGAGPASSGETGSAGAAGTALTGMSAGGGSGSGATAGMRRDLERVRLQGQPRARPGRAEAFPPARLEMARLRTPQRASPAAPPTPHPRGASPRAPPPAAGGRARARGNPPPAPEAWTPPPAPPPPIPPTPLPPPRPTLEPPAPLRRRPRPSSRCRPRSPR